MFDFWFVIFFISLITTIIMFLSVSFGEMESGSVKMESIEAGFSAVGGMYSVFSLQFSSLMIIFIIFDLELFFCFGLVKISMENILVLYSLLLFVFITLILEMKWAKVVWIK